MSGTTNPFFKHWFIFGEHPDGTVDVSSGSGDVLTDVPRQMAEEIIRLREDTLKRWGLW